MFSHYIQKQLKICLRVLALTNTFFYSPDVEFCGYSIPHPSESKMNIRIQTYGETTAFQALQKGLKDLVDLCNHTEDLFRQKVNEGNYSQVEPL